MGVAQLSLHSQVKDRATGVGGFVLLFITPGGAWLYLDGCACYPIHHYKLHLPIYTAGITICFEYGFHLTILNINEY